MRIIAFAIITISLFSANLKSQVFSNDSTELLRLCQAFGGINAVYTTVSSWNSSLNSFEQWVPSNPVSNWRVVSLVQDQTGVFRVSSFDLGGQQLNNLLALLS